MTDDDKPGRDNQVFYGHMIDWLDARSHCRRGEPLPHDLAVRLVGYDAKVAARVAGLLSRLPQPSPK